jgi:hypothetical protein
MDYSEDCDGVSQEMTCTLMKFAPRLPDHLSMAVQCSAAIWDPITSLDVGRSHTA